MCERSYTHVPAHPTASTCAHTIAYTWMLLRAHTSSVTHTRSHALAIKHTLIRGQSHVVTQTHESMRTCSPPPPPRRTHKFVGTQTFIDSHTHIHARMHMHVPVMRACRHPRTFASLGSAHWNLQASVPLGPIILDIDRMLMPGGLFLPLLFVFVVVVALLVHRSSRMVGNDLGNY